MSALALPGDIPGLLRRGSPVAATIGNLPDQRGIYVMRDPERADRACLVVEDLPGYGQIIAWPLVTQCALDLTDATGRVHAAWWLQAQGVEDMEAAIERIAGTDDAGSWLDWWFCGAEDATPERIAGLRDVVLHVAGRAP